MKVLRSRYTLALLLIGTVAAVLIIAIVPPWEEELFTDQHYERLKEGMTRGEVEGVLGGPAGDYSQGKGGPYHFGWHVRIDKMDLPSPAEIRDEWYGPHGAIWIEFGNDGRLRNKTLLGTYSPPPPTFWKRIKIWLDSWTKEEIVILA